MSEKNPAIFYCFGPGNMQTEVTLLDQFALVLCGRGWDNPYEQASKILRSREQYIRDFEDV